MGARLSQLKKKMPSGYRQKLCKDCKMNVHQIQGRPEDRISPVFWSTLTAVEQHGLMLIELKFIRV